MLSLDLHEEPRRLVLVVEDEMLVRFVISDMLLEMGMQVVEAASGDEALRFLRMVGSVDLVFYGCPHAGADRWIGTRKGDAA